MAVGHAGAGNHHIRHRHQLGQALGPRGGLEGDTVTEASEPFPRRRRRRVLDGDDLHATGKEVARDGFPGDAHAGHKRDPNGGRERHGQSRPPMWMKSA